MTSPNRGQLLNHRTTFPCSWPFLSFSLAKKSNTAFISSLKNYTLSSVIFIICRESWNMALSTVPQTFHVFSGMGLDSTFIWRKCWSLKIVGERGSPSQQAFIWEKSRLLCPIQELTITLARALWVSRLDRVDPGGRAKVFLWIKLAWLGGCFYQRKSLVQLDGYHSSRANVLFLM